MDVKMILAMDEKGTIGKDGGLPWKLKTDLQRFKKLTVGNGFNAVVMGSKTWFSLPNAFRPLPDRVNIVMSRNTNLDLKGAELALYDGRAIEIGYSEGCDELWVIGGAQIYELMLPRCKEAHLTRVHTTVEGRTVNAELHLDEFNEKVVETLPKSNSDEFDTTYSVFTR